MDYNPQESLQNTVNTFGTLLGVPSKELTYPPKNGDLEDDFPFPKVGCVSSLEGTPSCPLFDFSFQFRTLPFEEAMPRPLSFRKPQSVGCCSLRVG